MEVVNRIIMFRVALNHRRWAYIIIVNIYKGFCIHIFFFTILTASGQLNVLYDKILLLSSHQLPYCQRTFVRVMINACIFYVTCINQWFSFLLLQPTGSANECFTFFVISNNFSARIEIINVKTKRIKRQTNLQTSHTHTHV